MDEKAHEVVLVQVFGSDLLAGGCSCSPGSSCCGADSSVAEPAAGPSIEEKVTHLGDVLKRYYGSHVKAEYIDIIEEDMAAHPGVVEFIVNRGVSLPLVMVNGKPRFAGGLPLDKITAEVEALGITPLVDM